MTLPFAQSNFAEAYEQGLVGPLFRPFAEATLDKLSPGPGARVLDVACGTGIVARLAKQRVGGAGKVVGVDVNPGMLAVARTVATDVDWRQGSADALPLQDNERFDLVTCQQGLQFFPDRLAAAREMHRVVAPNGRLAVSTWRPDEEIPVIRELRRVAEQHVGPIADRRHSFGDPAAVEELLRTADFRDVRSQTLSRTIRFANATVFVRMNAMALVGMSANGKDMGEDERRTAVADIVRDSTEAIQPWRTGSALVFELSTVLATATV
jgi:ubiquinone/menaquinone biosynthesis C-methylase UbiE